MSRKLISPVYSSHPVSTEKPWRLSKRAKVRRKDDFGEPQVYCRVLNCDSFADGWDKQYCVRHVSKRPTHKVKKFIVSYSVDRPYPRKSQEQAVFLGLATRNEAIEARLGFPVKETDIVHFQYNRSTKLYKKDIVRYFYRAFIEIRSPL